jgi:hypothetical protein
VSDEWANLTVTINHATRLQLAFVPAGKTPVAANFLTLQLQGCKSYSPPVPTVETYLVMDVGGGDHPRPVWFSMGTSYN